MPDKRPQGDSGRDGAEGTSCSEVTRPNVSALVLATLATGAFLAPGTVQAQGYRSCEPVRNPYPNSRYEDVDLTRIRTLGVSCRSARRVARRAHRKALGLGLPMAGPIRRFTWRSWNVTGDLRGDHDRYVARQGQRRVRWRF
jgi:hypothetical protein